MDEPSKKNNDNQALAGFRQQIDALDDKIIDLLLERTSIIAQVGDWKRANSPGKCPIRPGREAQMLRRLTEKLAGSPLNVKAAAAMWRILIGSSTCIEMPLSLSVYAPGGEDTLYWLAREYFGPSLPVIRQPHVNRVIGDVKDGKASIGIVPTIQDGDNSNWWGSLMSPEANTPKIFAHVPFVIDAPDNRAPAALAISCIAPEATGNDISLVVIEADHNVSQSRMQTVFQQNGLQARWINIYSPHPSSRLHLIEVHNFVDGTDAPMMKFLAEMGNAITKVNYLGAYAVPITLPAAPAQAAHVATQA